jgi:predicted transglutaminase-like cysteine proteinase
MHRFASRPASVRRSLLLPGLLLLAGCAGPPKAPDRVSPPAKTPAQQRIDAWQELVRTQRDAGTEQKLEQVNRFFNQLEFVDDASHWGRDDYWATPLETLASNGGDCEDFTIAKYFTLKRLALPERQMRLIYVKSLTLNQPHMVLGYYSHPQADPLLLDNLIDTIVPAAQRRDLVPVYSFNSEGLWLAKQRGQGELVGDAAQLGLWQELLRRMRAPASGP